jgi:hypothetical protein
VLRADRPYSHTLWIPALQESGTPIGHHTDLPDPRDASSGGHVRGSGVRSGLRVILGWTLCGDGGDGHLRVGGVRVGDLGEAAFGEDVQADVATHLNPFVVLLGEHSAHQADQSRSVGKDADDDGAAVDFPVQSLLIGSACGAGSVLRATRSGTPTEPDASNRLRQLNRQQETYVNVS